MGTSFLQQRWRDLSLQDVYTKLQKILDSALHMRDMINRFLSASAEATGALEITPEPVDFAQTTLKVVNEYRNRAAEKHIVIHSHSFVPDMLVMLDQGVLREILENLLSNAVKYSPHGSEIHARIIGSVCSEYQVHLYDHSPVGEQGSTAGSYNFLRVEIEDEGPGIAANEQKLLFKKFTQLTAKPTGGEDSTGLGLSIVKRLVEALSGHVWCQSEPGRGATFIVEFPCTLAREQKPNKQNSSKKG
jgi:signal transduction histidine kinase